MRIAFVAPLFECVPPRGYGGTERVISCILEELVKQGHDCTLYAAAGSKTAGNFVETSPVPLFDEGYLHDWQIEFQHLASLEKAMCAVPAYDVIHVHQSICHYHVVFMEKYARNPSSPAIVWTDHNGLHLFDGKPKVVEALADLGVRVTSISNSHGATLPTMNWAATVHHGIPEDTLKPSASRQDYVAFLGRVDPEKGLIPAIRIAHTAGEYLKIAAKINSEQDAMFESEIKPLIDITGAEYIGTVNETQKGPFLSGAKALLFPISWKEPFGLVMIEAMACGCPVIAYPCGSVPEVVEDGLTGFIVENEEQAVDALRKVETLDRNAVRKRFEERWTSKVMANNYLKLFGEAHNAKLAMAEHHKYLTNLTNKRHSVPILPVVLEQAASPSPKVKKAIEKVAPLSPRAALAV